MSVSDCCSRTCCFRTLGLGNLQWEAVGTLGSNSAGGTLVSSSAGGTKGTVSWTLHIDKKSKNPYEQSASREIWMQVITLCPTFVLYIPIYLIYLLELSRTSVGDTLYIRKPINSNAHAWTYLILTPRRTSVGTPMFIDEIKSINQWIDLIWSLPNIHNSYNELICNSFI